MTFEDTLKYVTQMNTNFTRFTGTSPFLGINIEIVEPAWYNTSMGVDVALRVY